MITIKRWLLIPFAVAVLAVFALGGWQLYLYFRPNVWLVNYAAEDIPLPAAYVRTGSVFGMSPAASGRLKTWQREMNDMGEFIMENYEKPLKLSTEVEVEGGKTYITYTGYGTRPDGEVETIDKKVVLDFVVAPERKITRLLPAAEAE